MKICPTCKTTYSDDGLNFCLEDGSVLSPYVEQSYSPPPTVASSAPFTASPPAFTEPEIKTLERRNAPKKSGSKLWILAVFLVLSVMVICGGGIVGYFALVPNGGGDDPENDATPTPSTRKGDGVGDPDRRLRFSEKFALWNVETNKYISSEHKDGKFILKSAKNFYYVILAKNSESWDSSVLLRVQNMTGARTELGYGLVFHSSPDAVLVKDYAFLIRSDNGTYRIVEHVAKKEKVLVGWTKSSAINKGDEENDLEVRSSGSEMGFYINGKLVKTLTDKRSYKDGVSGIYTSDSIPIAFLKMEIRR
ncbi:MAG: hypothetical protein R2684_10905 [Pyrinomonadaceae bacterium]